ncbi:MAG: hypothetical protein JXB62_01785 [Pirellulales bacterium]|nr:hypothetical protein [Pirellulales bacterium]
MSRELEQLHGAWIGLIEDAYSVAHRDGFVHGYFALLSTSVKRFVGGEIGLHVLRKVVGFETFHVSDRGGPLAAGIVNVRNPAYMLSRLALPNTQHNPKYLPLICPFDDNAATGGLYCHYRRISLDNSGNIQLFVYPPVEPPHNSPNYVLIRRLFRAFTVKNDPWVEKRSGTLFDCVLDKVLGDYRADQIRLVDMACGSARLTVELCRKAFNRHRKSFDLTLVDVVRPNKSLAQVFYRNPLIFDRLVFRQDSLFDWVEDSSTDQAAHFDIVLMLRVLDVFSHFHIETLSRHEMMMLVRRDREDIVLDEDVLDPSKLIESAKHDRIQHTTKKTRLRRGSMFYQFSLSDYFKAMHLATGAKVDGTIGAAHVAIRRFDDGVLVLPSGRSLIGQLMERADRIVVEDVDVTARHLRRHIDEFGLSSLCVTDMSDRQRVRGAFLTLVDKRS